MDTSVLIGGAGIGGLAAALALHTRGYDVAVIERASELRALGVGINLLPHAVRELYGWGLRDDLAGISVAPHSIDFCDDSGALLFRERRGIAGGYGYPQLSVHRGRLQMLLLSAVRDRMGGATVQTGSAVEAFDITDDGVTVHTGEGRIRADVLVGADGLHSAVRSRLHPADDPLLWSGTRMFRGAARTQPFLDGHTMAIIKGRNGIDLVAYPIADDEVNWVLMIPAAEGPAPCPDDAAWNRPGHADDVLPSVDGWSVPWLDVNQLIADTPDIFEYPMVDRDVLPRWGRGPVTLLGDAAHPMYPVGANGGSQAILDAAALAGHLAAATTVSAGLRAYEDDRRTATADVIAANREMHAGGTTRRPAQLEGAAQRYRRDTHADDTTGAPV